MSAQIKFISDTHFGHKNILKFSSKWRQGTTVAEHDEWLLDSINSNVQKRDVLWLLGDLAFTREGLENVKKIRCNVHMCLGNHDTFPMNEYIELGTVRPSIWKYKGFWLSHAPIHPKELRGCKNIHGHVHHQTITKDITYGEYADCGHEPDPNYINVCVEVLNGVPIALEDIV